MRIDAHQHLWRFDPVEYGWIDEKATALRRDYLHADLARELTASGLDGAVAVQARQSLAENDFLLAAGRRHRPDASAASSAGWTSPPTMWTRCSARYAARPRFVGVRHVVQGETDPGIPGAAGVQPRRRRLAAPRPRRTTSLIYAAAAARGHRLVDRHPSQPFVLDHIAKPAIVDGSIRRGLGAIVPRIAKRPHVTCKLSGVVTEVRDATWSVDVDPAVPGPRASRRSGRRA